MDRGLATVRAKVITTKGVEVPVQARLVKRAEHWQIYDIAIESVSLISNYRSQFNHIIRTSSYGELVRRLTENRDQFLNQKPVQVGRTP